MTLKIPHITNRYSFFSGKLPTQKNFSDYLGMNMIPLAHPRVRIVLFNTVVMEPMNSDIILPCKTIGMPKPDVFWIDNNKNKIISNEDSRVMVMPDGELRIKNLDWLDMGDYTCVASNDFSKDSITTFVYPLVSLTFICFDDRLFICCCFVSG